MRLILATLALAGAIGFIAGGRPSALASLKVRWTPAALIGLALQLAPAPGPTWGLVLLFASFVLLTGFAVVNVGARLPGFVLILLGVVMNFTVIGVNQGMPVSREALVASHQEKSLPILLERPGAKHHLAGPDDRLMLLADVIAVPPLEQVISLGDILAYTGVVWLVVAGMRRREPLVAPKAAVPAEGAA
jgi:Family of unknown function (DUF5317)